MSTTFNTILYEVHDGLARLTMNRPERRNAMTNEMVVETAAALELAAADASLRVLVLTGSGTSFCPGADLNWVAGSGGGEVSESSRAADARLAPEHFRIPALLHEMRAVTIALVNGACAGAAMGWACGCDLRVATRSAKFNTAFLDVGVAGDMGLPWSLPRLVGASKARELTMLPDKFDADEARCIGLVARVFDDESFASSSDALVQRLLAMSPPALATLKQNFLDAERLGYSDFTQLEAERHIHLFTLDDTREAFAAKVEKRAPRWTGH